MKIDTLRFNSRQSGYPEAHAREDNGKAKSIDQFGEYRFVLGLNLDSARNHNA
jgi:hypothetical protein